MQKAMVESVLGRYNGKRATKTKSKEPCSRITANLIVKNELHNAANPLQAYRDMRRERQKNYQAGLKKSAAVRAQRNASKVRGGK